MSMRLPHTAAQRLSSIPMSRSAARSSDHDLEPSTWTFSAYASELSYQASLKTGTAGEHSGIDPTFREIKKSTRALMLNVIQRENDVIPYLRAQ